MTVHLDTNLLIAATAPHDHHAAVVARLIACGGPLATSACAWTEYRSRPVDPLVEKILRRMLGGGILAFDESAAVLAGELFRLTGATRRTRLDTMIAATAIAHGAALATTNPGDFQPFLEHGLKLHKPDP